MKNPIIPRLLPVLLLAAASTAFAGPETKKEIRIHRGVGPSDGPHFNFKVGEPGPVEMEKVAYLGIETLPVDPTVAVQLGLPRGTGVVVRRVAKESPADGVLQEHDVLTKLDDQILVNMAQLTVLVRNRKAGDEVRLTYIRGGKEAAAKVRLGEHEVPKVAWETRVGAPAVQVFGHSGLPGGGVMGFSPALPAMPVLPPNEPGDVMRVIGRERNQWFAQPRVHVLRRAGHPGATILDLAAGSFVFSDDKGSVEINATDGKRELTVKDKDGKVAFQGPITSPEDRDKLPAEVRRRIDEIGGAEFGDETDGIEVETRVFDPASKIRFELPEFPDDETTGPEAGMRTL